MAKCNTSQLQFASCQNLKVQADFQGGEVSSDGGLLLLREVDQQLNLLKRVASLLPDTRNPELITHTRHSQICQRIFALAQGYEDLNDHQSLRDDTLLQTAAGQKDTLSSPSTLCRMEAQGNRHCAKALNELLVEVFIESFRQAPEELILDFDATDDPVHGQQEGRFFHGYYGHYCFLPLYVFCGSHPLCAWLRPSNIDGARGSWAVLKMLVTRLRKAWPQVKIIFRGDSGFCRWRMLRWCENYDIGYVVGFPRNAVTKAQNQILIDQAEEDFQATGESQRHLHEEHYQAKSWDRSRKMITKVEHNEYGSNLRHILSNLEGSPEELYDNLYCARGDMENRIKEQQLGLFADRTSCQRWWPNQLRLLESTLAYVLIDGLRRLALRETEWVNKQVSTLRCQLLKVGAVIIRNTRRVIVHLSSSWPSQDIYRHAYRQLQAGGSG